MNELANPFEQAMLIPDMESMLKEFTEGKPIGESGRVEGLKDQFSWKRAFINCWTGLPNFGKTSFLNFMSVNKSKHDDWKWCIWSPEMISSHKVNGNIAVSAGDIYDELIHCYTGKNPYKHFTDRYGIPQMSMDEYMEALEWVQDRFYVISPKDKNYKNIIDTYMYWYEKEGFDGWIVDPFKNIQFDITGTMDNVLHRIFDDFKDCSIISNSSINIVAHPKSNNEPKRPDGSYKPCTQFDLLGGAAWNNSMDGIFSLHRPFAHKDPNDPTTWLYHVKQRKKHLVGDTGVYKHIEFVPKTNRYHFDGKCPIDGSFKQPIVRDSEGVPLPVQPIEPIRAGQSDITFETAEDLEFKVNQDEPNF